MLPQTRFQASGSPGTVFEVPGDSSQRRRQAILTRLSAKAAPGLTKRTRLLIKRTIGDTKHTIPLETVSKSSAGTSKTHDTVNKKAIGDTKHTIPLETVCSLPRRLSAQIRRETRCFLQRRVAKRRVLRGFQRGDVAKHRVSRRFLARTLAKRRVLRCFLRAASPNTRVSRGLRLCQELPLVCSSACGVGRPGPEKPIFENSRVPNPS